MRCGLKKCEEWDVRAERRIRRRKRMDGELAQDEGMTMQTDLHRVMLSCVDRLVSEMDCRFKRLKKIDFNMGFLLDVEELCYGKQPFLEECKRAAETYSGDFDGEELCSEIKGCRMLLCNRQEVEEVQTPIQLLNFCIKYGEESFPNLQRAITILLTVAVSVASCERSFSKLKLLKTYLRSTMANERLSNLAILAIEKNELSKIDINKIIDKFLNSKRERLHRLQTL